jgi:hypothetical protein
MKVSRKVALVVSPLVLAAALVPVLSAGANKSQQPQEAGTRRSGHNWRPGKVRVSPDNSRLDLELPDLAADADWIVGVQPTDGEDKETVSVGLVSWEGSDENPATADAPVKLKLVSKVTDYPTHQINSSRGRVSLPNLNGLDRNSGSLIVFLRVSPGTQVRVRRGGKEFGATGDGFIVHNGVVEQTPPKGLHSLVGRLVRSEVLSTSGARRRTK